MRNSEFNANRELSESASITRAQRDHAKEKARHAKRRAWRDHAKDVIYPGSAVGVAVRLSGFSAAIMALSSFSH